ncbi:MAG: hypothetical protein KatS3mg042_0657 [Rhodothermaceae bacterium]|nr:MAG: hypothetical protein KatS3mg042_0657 [Rhodothermaceae bacterium]
MGSWQAYVFYPAGTTRQMTPKPGDSLLQFLQSLDRCLASAPHVNRTTTQQEMALNSMTVILQNT